MEIRNILVPVDFSECSKNALRVAIHLAKRWHSTLHLVNAVNLPIGQTGTMSYPFAEPYLSDQESLTKQYFETLVVEIPEISEVLYHIKQHFASIPEAIMIEIQSKSIDVVIMGTKSKHGLLERVLGSISLEIINNTDIPVLVIPENATTQKIKNIGFAADFKSIKFSDQLIMVRFLAEAYNSSVVIFQVNTEDEVGLDKFPSARKLRNLFSPAQVSFEIVNAKDTLTGILQMVDSHHLNMVVMLPKPHGIFTRLMSKSTTQKMCLELKVPLLALH